MASNLKEFAQELKQRVGIEQVLADYIPTLHRHGRTLKGLCPFHNEKTPSFHVNAEFGFYYCFGCQAKGDVIRFVQDYEKVDFVLAVETIARRFGVPIPEFKSNFTGEQRDEAERKRQTLLAICKLARDFFRDQLSRPNGSKARDYLAGRGLSPEQMQAYELGYAPDSFDGFLREAERRGYAADRVADAGLAVRRENGGFYDRFRNRVMFPITDHRGDVVAFGGRLMEGEGPKYLNSSDTPLFHKGKLLYGLTASREAIREAGRVILLEGYMDWIALHSLGLRNCLAGLGTAFGEEQARMLKRFTGEVVVCYDGDEAGRKAAFRATELLLAQDINVRLVALPEPHDPDSYIREIGTDAMREVIEQSPPALDAFVDQAASTFAVYTPEGKSQAAEWLTPLLAALTNPIMHDAYVGRAAARLGIDDQALRKLLARRRSPASREDAEAQKHFRAEPGGFAGAGGAKFSAGIEKRELYLVHRLLQHLHYWDLFATLTPDLFSNPNLRNIFSRMHEHARDLREGALPLEDVFSLCSTEDETEILSRALMIGDHLAEGRLKSSGEPEPLGKIMAEVDEIRLLLFQRMTRRLRGEIRSKVGAGPRADGHGVNHSTIHSVGTAAVRATELHYIGERPPEESAE